uniref:hypothetical protein n=1 Tax=uncultured Halomonas sp. TaxID=173971 RepID=UPI002618987A
MAYVEQQGELSLKVDGDGVYRVETTEGDIALKRPNGRAYAEGNNTFTQAEPDPESDGYVAV